MTATEWRVLVVEDDFRVANMHAGIVDALPGFTVAGTANTLAAAREAGAFDVALVDVYLPDGSGIDFVRGQHGDAIMLSASTESETIRAALSAGALSYLVKPFGPAELAARLSGYGRYRAILSGNNLGAADVDAALDALRPRVVPLQSPAAPSPTKQVVLQALTDAATALSAAEVAAATGVSRATAQRYLAGLATSGEVSVGLRYGATGRPEQEFLAKTSGSRKLNRPR